MSKKIKQPSNDPTSTSFPSFHRKKILPLKHKFFKFQSDIGYEDVYEPQILEIIIKNPKWCHLYLKPGNTDGYEEYRKLRRAKSFRLRSLYLDSFSSENSSNTEDWINRYFGELDAFLRTGQTLKKLSLSVIHDESIPFRAEENKPEAYIQLKKFVKKQKYLDELGIYLGSCGYSEWMSDLLKYQVKAIKTLTIQNLAVEEIFQKYDFPKLESLRFEYLLYKENEERFDFALLSRSLQDIFALPSLKTLIFSQYMRYPMDSYKYYREDFEEDNNGKSLEFDYEFWEDLKFYLAHSKEKPLKIKYHRKEDDEIEEKVKMFKKLFGKMPPGQTFEYEIAMADRLSEEEIKERGLATETEKEGRCYFIHYWDGVRYLITLDEIETMGLRVFNWEY